jgi:TetR/AcrR family transcriptional regulator
MGTDRGTKPKPSLASPRDGAATRARILKTAGEIFAAEGLAGARTDAIAAAAGVNKALLYYYFKSKDGLYRAVLEDHFQEFSRHAMEIFAAGEPPGRALLRYVSYHFDFIGARPYYPRLIQRLMMAGGLPAERMVRKHMTPVGKMLRKVIDQGARTGEFRAFDSQHTAISLVALIVFYFGAAASMRRRGAKDPFRKANLARRKEEVLKFIRYALFRDPEAVAA